VPDASSPTAVRLADLTTLRLGGPAPELITATTRTEVADAVRAADAAGGVLVLGGGSNLVVADAGVEVPVVRVAVPGLDVRFEPDGSATVTIGAGVTWDDVVAELTGDGFGELAPLAGIPGSTGATPVQNVGAYGTEIGDLLVGVTLYDRVLGVVRTVAAADLGLGYRTSVLRGTDRAVVLDVTLRLHRGDTVARYAELARALGVTVGGAAPPGRVREAVLELRRAKGMVLDPADPDTTSAGSFFTNPILDEPALALVDGAIRARLGGDVRYPSYPAEGPPRESGPTGRGAGGAARIGEDGRLTKLSAAWLIERAGFGKGHPGPGGRVAISSKHTLALTNRGGASTADLLVLAREVRDGVAGAFTVVLQPEPVFVGVALD
jgi:UDP-N-acetylmuramate dehydrogenase